ncbi:Hsp20/alpha crystallin family protein [uncultured Thiodictyon sp.]|uniref:Hsp20/alpha crystallin family protein n=1 Tax=uncultured Thiodictyon sp. TaxID=1846217 RepID=UPI0025FE941C|nr:Hsp20/alpha crystallin family protein [uncultured Thiodictyon sp.]
MSTLQQIRQDLTQVWDHLRDGWQRLADQAAGAVTRFTQGGRDAAAGPPAARSNIWAIPGRGTLGTGEGWGILAAEVIDEDDRVLVRLEAPGMDKDDFALEVRDGHLVVRGEKQIRRKHKAGRYQVTECAYGHFERAIPLPDAVRSDQSSASYKRGVLRVELPKDPARQRRRIQVQVR